MGGFISGASVTSLMPISTGKACEFERKAKKEQIDAVNPQPPHKWKTQLPLE